MATQTETITAYLQENPDAKPKAAAEALGVTANAVSQVKTRLKKGKPVGVRAKREAGERVKKHIRRARETQVGLNGIHESCELVAKIRGIRELAARIRAAGGLHTVQEVMEAIGEDAEPVPF